MWSARMTSSAVLKYLAQARKTGRLPVRLYDIHDHCHKPVTTLTFRDAVRMRQPVVVPPPRGGLVFETVPKAVCWLPHVEHLFTPMYDYTPDIQLPPLLFSARVSHLSINSREYFVFRITHDPHPFFYAESYASVTDVDMSLFHNERWTRVAFAVSQPAQFDTIYRGTSALYRGLAIGPDDPTYNKMMEYF